MKHVKFIVAILLMLIVVILLVQNHQAMSTSVVFRIDLLNLHLVSSELNLYYIVTIVFLFGLIVSGLYGMMERFRLKREIKALARTSREKDKELNSLRNLPITSDDVGPAHPEDADKEV
jgi:uncharacterized membrane protein YciS (DUF1049 family)